MDPSPSLPLCAATDPLPRAAYIHVPFCVHRCGYCNFSLIAGRDDLIDGYLEAVARELASLGEPLEVDTLFFGGGTPTHLSPKQLDQLCRLVLKWLPLAEAGELSIEANPLDLNDTRAEVLESHGVTRISLGVQSFDERKLAILERDHRADSIQRAFQFAARVADSVSLDLIFGAPNETLETWRRDITLALALGPQHVSTYGLTIERGTMFWNRHAKGELHSVDEMIERAMYLAAMDQLTAAGLEHYEVSNFALPGHRCRHNENYWLGQPYAAFGPGAACYTSGVREVNHRSTTTYIRRMLAGQSPVADRERLTPLDRAKEFFVFAMRRIQGIERRHFCTATGFEIDAILAGPLRKYVDLGMIVDDHESIRLTREGLLVSDALWPEFLNSA